ncbi:G-protein coupled receptor 26 [Neoarius graeffei]|uniref:G-protein coupled receptor 26 n=1 Tax=Neoarius graeffei TaxID=443677 RepID=UPI00298C06E7|nr:G-protein coupled receptor 26 [Neoarius graeffei]
MGSWDTLLLECVLASVAVVSLLSNSLVLLCFSRSSEIRARAPGLFILNLSLCNILSTVLNVPTTLLALSKNQKPFGDSLCRAASFADIFLTTNAMLSMAALGVDRWAAVAFPLTYSSRVKHKHAALMVFYAWMHSLALSTVPALFSWTDYSPVYASCTVHLQQNEPGFAVFTVVFHCTSFALTLLVLCVTYLKVLQVARFHCKRIDVITVQTLLVLVDIHPSVKQRCLMEQKRRRQRATKKVCIFIGSFVFCFTPYVITRLTELIPSVQINPQWGVISKCLVYSKAAMDPFVYSLPRQEYRKALIGMTNTLSGCKYSSSSDHNNTSYAENDSNMQRVS